jgi:hypothetical protein
MHKTIAAGGCRRSNLGAIAATRLPVLMAVGRLRSRLARVAVGCLLPLQGS